MRGNAMFVDDADNVRHHVGFAEMTRRKINADPNFRQLGFIPGNDLTTRLVNHPFVDGDDQ